MANFRAFGAALLFLVLASLPARADTACAIDTQPTVLVEKGEPNAAGSRLLKVWEVENAPVLWSEAVPDEKAYSDFRAEIASRGIETDPVVLLKRSLTANNQIVIRNADQWIKPAGCLEMLMYGLQHARMNTFTSPTEFGTFVLRSADEQRLRIYFYTNNQDGLGNMDVVVAALQQDRQAGWNLLVALHSHVFHPGQPEIDGLLSPSEPDAGFHANIGASLMLREAWITNGIHTVRMPASSFGEFSTGAPR